MSPNSVGKKREDEDEDEDEEQTFEKFLDITSRQALDIRDFLYDEARFLIHGARILQTPQRPGNDKGRGHRRWRHSCASISQLSSVSNSHGC